MDTIKQRCTQYLDGELYWSELARYVLLEMSDETTAEQDEAKWLAFAFQIVKP